MKTLCGGQEILASTFGNQRRYCEIEKFRTDSKIIRII